MRLLGLAVAAVAWPAGLLAQATAPSISWDDLLKQMVAQAFPVLLGFLVHWLGVRARTAPDASQAPSPSSTP